MTRSRSATLALMVFALAGCTSPNDGANGNGNGNGNGSGTGTGSGGGSTGSDAGATMPPGSDGGAGTTPDGGAGSGPTTPTGCPDQNLLPLPVDPSARGPWPVGARTVTLAGLTTEIWYPAVPGSDAGQPTVNYDIREHLPAADAMKIPDSDNPLQPCDCVRNLPLDAQHGPYPVVLFIHGTAAFRTQSLTFMTHWASRGFVVVAADHPGIQLKDVLSSPLGLPGASDQSGDARKMLAALSPPTADAQFLDGHIDMKRLALSGHSAGGGAIAGFGDVAQVLIPMAAQGTQAAAALKSSLIMGAGNDGIDSYSNVTSGYSSSPKPKRLVGLGGNAGHLAFSDLCAIGASEGGILQIAQNHGVQVPALIASLARDGCKAGQLAPMDGWHIVDFASSAVLEDTLQCSPTAAMQIAGIMTAVPNVQEYQADL